MLIIVSGYMRNSEVAVDALSIWLVPSPEFCFYSFISLFLKSMVCSLKFLVPLNF